MDFEIQVEQPQDISQLQQHILVLQKDNVSSSTSSSLITSEAHALTGLQYYLLKRSMGEILTNSSV